MNTSHNRVPFFRVKMLQTSLGVLPTLATFHGLQAFHGRHDPLSTVLSGGSAGRVCGAISAFQRRQVFPEAAEELRFFSLRQTLLKGSIGFACAFTVYEGLTRGITKARWPTSQPSPQETLSDWSWHVSNFLAGGVSGIAFRAATVPLYRGVIENPLLTPRGAVLLGSSFVQMGIAMGLGSAAKAVFDAFIPPSPS